MPAVLDLGDLEQPSHYDSIDIILLQCRILACFGHSLGRRERDILSFARCWVVVLG